MSDYYFSAWYLLEHPYLHVHFDEHGVEFTHEHEHDDGGWHWHQVKP